VIGGYVARRILALIPTLFFASLIVFFTIRLIPGSVIDLMLSQNDGSASGLPRAQLEAALGFDQPIYIQYFRWLGSLLLHGNLGNSLWTGTPVMDEVVHRLPVTFELGAMALIISLSIGVPIGVYAALRQNTIGDYFFRSVSILALAIPGFWIGTLVAVLPALWWGWSPAINYVSLLQDPVAHLVQLLVPALILAMASSALIMRLTRTMMLEVLRQDYIRTAYAKGLPVRTIMVRHALRNALIPVITLIGLLAPLLFGGTIIMEQIFAIPGMGLLLLEAVGNRDYPMITGVFLITGVAVIIINLLVDLSYGWFDPKVRTR
jgi:peptide/nickel transport system permease protein